MAEADYRLMTEATGQRIAIALENLAGFGNYLTTNDVVNNLTSTATDKPLSAAQGKALNDKLFSKITSLYSGDDLNNIHGDGVNHLYYIGSGVTNSPTDYAIMIVGSREGNTGLCAQIVVGYDVYSRVFIGSPPSWSSWKKLS